MKRVITYGTYDMLHPGHINLLRRARELGDRLIVGLSTDEFNAVKNKSSFYTYEERRLVVASIRYVDEVIPERCWEQKTEDIRTYQIDIFVMGSDWSGHFDFLKPYCDVVYLPRTEGISSTSIKTELSGSPVLANIRRGKAL